MGKFSRRREVCKKVQNRSWGLTGLERGTSVLKRRGKIPGQILSEYPVRTVQAGRQMPRVSNRRFE